jgi:hypothetical protein
MHGGAFVVAVGMAEGFRGPLVPISGESLGTVGSAFRGGRVLVPDLPGVAKGGVFACRGPDRDEVAILLRCACPSLGSQGFIFVPGDAPHIEAELVIFGAIRGAMVFAI